MINRMTLLKVFIIVPIIILYHTLLFGSPSNSIDIPINDLLAESIFGRLQVGNSRSYTLIIEKMFYILVFNMLFGTYIYKNFLVSSVYLFSRLKNRKTWLYRKVFELFLLAGCYTLLFLGTLLFLCIYQSSYGVEGTTINMLVLLWGVITLFLTFVTLIINLLAIRLGSNVAFIIVYIFLILLVTLALFMRSIPSVIENPYLLLLNPVAAIILNMIDQGNMQFIGIIYFCMLNVIVIVFGAQYINRMDIALTDNESV